MMRRIWTLWQQDLTLALRDSILIYVLVSPLILAVLARLFVPGIEDVQFTFVVDDGAPPFMVAGLEAYGRVEIVDSVTALEERISRSDDVAGVLQDEQGWTVRLEGNEHEEHGEAVVAVLASILSDEPAATVTRRGLGGQRTPLLEYIAVCLIMLTMLMGALVAGFHIVDEKSSLAIRALAIAPLPIRDYLLARGLFSFILGGVLSLISTVIVVGLEVNYWKVTLGIVASVVTITLVAFIIGALASNQVQALAVVKVLMAVYLSVPVLAIFIPQQYHVTLYWLPNYWMFSTLSNAIVGEAPVGFWTSVGLTMATSVVLLAAMVPFLRRRFRLR